MELLKADEVWWDFINVADGVRHALQLSDACQDEIDGFARAYDETRAKLGGAQPPEPNH